MGVAVQVRVTRLNQVHHSNAHCTLHICIYIHHHMNNIQQLINIIYMLEITFDARKADCAT